MHKFIIQFMKEFKAYFSSYNAYVIIPAYYILSMFMTIYIGEYFLKEADIMNSYFSLQPLILILVLPAVTMRSWAEEAKNGTLELLLTQPISYFTLVTAKVFASFCFFLILVSSSLVLFICSAKFSVLDMGVTLSGYAALILCGILFCTVGCLVSAFNQKNILSYVMTIFVLFVITQIRFTDLTLGKYIIPLDCLIFNYNYNAFLEGNFSFANIAYFIVATILCLWLNTILFEYKKTNLKSDIKSFRIFCFLLLSFFAALILSVEFNLPKKFDLTAHKIYTLQAEHIKYLENLNKKIDITLYESAEKRKDDSSQFAVYATFVEKTFSLIQQASGGVITFEVVQVPSFSQLERRLIFTDKVKYEEDNLGKKVFLAAKFSDNNGNETFIKSFSNLRQNLLETDILRIIKYFGLPKKKIAVIADSEELESMRSFTDALNEFYSVSYFEKSIIFIPDYFETAIVIEPKYVSSEFLLAMDQYVLDGGNLIMFNEPENLNEVTEKPLLMLLNNFGIHPVPSQILTYRVNDENLKFGVAKVENTKIFNGIHDIMINEVGEINGSDDFGFKIKSLLKFNQKNIAVVSSGQYVSNYLQEAVESDKINAVSKKDGKVFFIYDCDILKDNIYISELSKDYSFYESFAFADNILFLLRLVDYAVDGNIETNLYYKYFNVTYTSIGKKILTNIKLNYADEQKKLENILEKYKNHKSQFESSVRKNGFISARNIGDISGAAQDIEQAEMDLYELKNTIFSDYKKVIICFTFAIIFVVPFVFVLILFLLIKILQVANMKKIRRLIDAE